MVWSSWCHWYLAASQCWLWGYTQGLDKSAIIRLVGWWQKYREVVRWKKSNYCQWKENLITHWAGNAYCKLISEYYYDNFRCWLFKKTGCLITADDSEDAKLTPEGLLNYELQPPIDIDPIAAAAISSTVPSPEPNVDEEDEKDDFEGENEHNNVEIVREDDIPKNGWIFDLFNMWLL